MKRLALIGLVAALLLASTTAVFAASRRRHPPAARSVKVSRTVGYRTSKNGSRAQASTRPTASGRVRNDGSKAQMGAGSRTSTGAQTKNPQTGKRRVNSNSSDGSGITITRNGFSGASASVNAKNGTGKLIPKL